MTLQLALNLPVRVDFSAESFVVGEANADAVAALERWHDWPGAVLALAGPTGAGKSHLAAIWAEQVHAQIMTPAGLETALPNLATGRCLVVEDIEFDLPETALFHAFNRVAEGTIPALLLVARKPPAHWPASLPDLLSRLRALPYVELREPDDDLLTELILKQIHDRGAPIRPGVIEYLLPRMERSVSAVRNLVDRMDKLALVRQTPITRSIARAVLDEMSEAGVCE